MRLSPLLLCFSKICLALSAVPTPGLADPQAASRNSSAPAVTTVVNLRDTLLYKKIIGALKARERELSGSPPRGYVDPRENSSDRTVTERRGPEEGKLAGPLIGSINGGASESNSGWKFAAPALTVFYRAAGAAPPAASITRDPDAGEKYATCFLLAAIAIAAVLLLYAVRNLTDASVAPPYKRIGGLGTGEKILFVYLVAVLFACLTALLGKTFLERYYPRRRELPIGTSIDPSTSAHIECLGRLVRDSGRVLCIAEDDGYAVRKPRGESGPQPLIPLEKFDLWRSIFAGRAANNSEKVRVNQLRLLQSGILNKWFPRQTVARNLEVIRENDEPREIRKFAHFVALVIISGCLVAFIVYLGERFVRNVKMRDRSLQYVYVE